jgi:hypothetical protein
VRRRHRDLSPTATKEADFSNVGLSHTHLVHERPSSASLQLLNLAAMWAFHRPISCTSFALRPALPSGPCNNISKCHDIYMTFTSLVVV